ncbi:MAG: YbhB/YbcL family Raf kinase inhibitor-like protein [Terriglobales bacterium]
MKSARTDLLASTLLGLLFAVLLATPVTAQQKQAPTMPFQLTSSEFSSDSTLPISMILNVVQNGVNLCSIDGSMGGDQSPELSWSNAPEHTQSYVVVTYDDTAAFTHWGMYNIPGTATGLPANAGVAGSTYGSQIANDFYAAEYDGPCPPPGVAPTVHHYVFTVYALDTTLSLPGSPNFAPNAETLYHALISAGRFHHILATARLVGLYSTTPAK